MLDFADKPQLRLLLDHFGLVEDDREPWRVAHPLPEVLLLGVCGTIGACDDFDEIAILPVHENLPCQTVIHALYCPASQPNGETFGNGQVRESQTDGFDESGKAKQPTQLPTHERTFGA